MNTGKIAEGSTVVGLSRDERSNRWSEVRTIAEGKAELPTMEWFRRNGHSGLITDIFRAGHSWEAVRSLLSYFASSHFRTSRSGIRWRSHPEACFSDFLYARGIPHRRGERYDAGYGALDEARQGRSARHIKWTPDTLAAAWAEFNEKYGVPLSMKMGTIPSRFPYDAAARNAFQLASLRCSAIQHYASWISPRLRGSPVTPQ